MSDEVNDVITTDETQDEQPEGTESDGGFQTRPQPQRETAPTQAGS